MRIRGWCGKDVIDLFLDTGSPVDLISFSTFEQLKMALGYVKTYPSDTCLVGVDGSPISVLFKCEVPILLEGKELIIIYPYVVSELSLGSHVLFGYQSMVKYAIDIMPAEGGIVYKDVFIPQVLDESPLLRNRKGGGVKRVKKHRKRAVKDAVTNIDCDPCLYGSDVLHTNMTNKKEKCLSSENDSGQGADEVWANGVNVNGSVLLPCTARIIKVQIKEVLGPADIITDPTSCPLSTLTYERGLHSMDKDGIFYMYIYNVSMVAVELESNSLIGKFQICPVPVCEIEVGPATMVAGIKKRSKQEVLEYLTVGECDVEVKNKLYTLLEKYSRVVALPGDSLGHTDQIAHNIPLKEGARPCYIPAYRIPHSQKEKIENIIADMESQGVIEMSKSPWNSPMFLVPKKGGELRPVVDFRKVNSMTLPDRYPIPNLYELLSSIGEGNQYFTSLDLLSGYWQISLDPAARPITAFSTPSGHYQYRRMPMGLCNSGATFQRLVNTLFHGLIGQTMFAYLDDIIIMSNTLEEHFKRLDQVFQRLEEAGLKIKLKKCHFLKKKIEFLGHTVDSQGLHTSQDKIVAVKNFPRPTSVDGIRSFLGLSGYYRAFIKDYARIAGPLSHLLKKESKFEWKDEQEASFNELKTRLCQAPILAYPDYKRGFILQTDASIKGLGAVLMQKHDDGKDRVVAYASRTLNKSEKNYSITHLEGLAIIFALKKFKYTILGYPIVIQTDHAPLRTLFQSKEITGRLARWAAIIQEFHPDIQYLPGKANKVADALSRQPVEEIANPAREVLAVNQEINVMPRKEEFLIAPEELVKAQEEDATWSLVRESVRVECEDGMPKIPYKMQDLYFDMHGILVRGNLNEGDKEAQIIIPGSLVDKILYQMHDTVHAAHPGVKKMIKQVRREYIWPTMNRDIARYIRNCKGCAKNKGKVNVKEEIENYPVPGEPWDTVAVDLLKLPLSVNGYQYVIVFCDHFSHFCVLVPSKDKGAKAVADAFINDIICKFTTPKVLLSDNGREFNNAILKEVCHRFKVKKVNVQAYHPAANGLVERSNRKILEVIRQLAGDTSHYWDEWLPQVAASINGRINESIKCSPHYVIYGREMRLPYHFLQKRPGPLYNIDDYVKVKVRDFQSIYQHVKQALSESKEKMLMKKEGKHGEEIHINDVIYLKNEERASKIDPKFIGPARVMNHLPHGKVCIRFEDDGRVMEVHQSRIKILGPCSEELPEITNVKKGRNKKVKIVNDEAKRQSDLYRQKLRSSDRTVVAYCESIIPKWWQTCNLNFYS